MGNALALTALVLFACNAFVVRAASQRLEQGLGFLVVLAANVAFSALATVTVLIIRGGLPRPSWSAVVLFLVGGVLSTYLGRRGYFRSVELMGPSRAASVQVTNPVFAAVFAWALLGERLRLWDALAMAVVVVGLLLTSQVPRPSIEGVASRRMTRMPLALLLPAVVASVCYALGNVARGGAVQQWNEPVVGGFLGALSGTVGYLLFHVSFRKLAADVRAANRRGLALWAGAGTITMAGQMAVIAATAHIPVGIAVAISAATPVLVIPASVLLFRNSDRVRIRTAVGACLIIGGVAGLVLR